MCFAWRYRAKQNQVSTWLDRKNSDVSNFNKESEPNKYNNLNRWEANWKRVTIRSVWRCVGRARYRRTPLGWRMNMRVDCSRTIYLFPNSSVFFNHGLIQGQLYSGRNTYCIDVSSLCSWWTSQCLTGKIANSWRSWKWCHSFNAGSKKCQSVSCQLTIFSNSSLFSMKHIIFCAANVETCMFCWYLHVHDRGLSPPFPWHPGWDAQKLKNRKDAPMLLSPRIQMNDAIVHWAWIHNRIFWQTHGMERLELKISAITWHPISNSCLHRFCEIWYRCVLTALSRFGVTTRYVRAGKNCTSHKCDVFFVCRKNTVVWIYIL